MISDFLGTNLTERLEDWQDQTKDSFYSVLKSMDEEEDNFLDKVEELAETIESWEEASPCAKNI